MCAHYEQLPYPQGYAYPSLRAADLQNCSARPIMIRCFHWSPFFCWSDLNKIYKDQKDVSRVFFIFQKYFRRYFFFCRQKINLLIFLTAGHSSAIIQHQKDLKLNLLNLFVCFWFVCLFVCLLVFFFVSMFLSTIVCLFVCKFVCKFVCLFVCLFVC